MTVTGLEAQKAYLQAANALRNGGAAGAVDDADFSGLLQNALSGAVSAASSADSAIAASAAGRGDLIEVVTAVAAAQASLETVVAVRDQVISAYQEILRMPI